MDSANPSGYDDTKPSGGRPSLKPISAAQPNPTHLDSASKQSAGILPKQDPGMDVWGGGGPSILEGWTPDQDSPSLCFGDIISLVGNDTNSCIAYAGAHDGRAWVVEIGKQASTPPNMEDCRFQVIPRRQYAEARRVNKLTVKGLWDDGKRLKVPDMREKMTTSTDKLADDFAKEHNLNPKSLPHLLEMMEALVSREDEHAENMAEYRRQEGQEVLYGSMCQLQHVSTGRMLTVSKLQAIERTEKKVEMSMEGTDAAVLVIKPAFKTHSQGEPVSSGDLVTFMTKRKIHGKNLFLHMSNFIPGDSGRNRPDSAPSSGSRPGTGSGQQMTLDLVLSFLKTDSEAIAGAQELNATAERPTFWRPMLFASSKDKHSAKHLLKAEEYVCFYDKDVEAYLSHTSEVGPHFRCSKRVSSKARKKSSWMWKIESKTLVAAGARVHCSDAVHYRLKHVVTGKYLKAEGETLTMTHEYWNPKCLFSFKRFSRASGDDSTNRNSLVFLRSAGHKPAWVTAAFPSDRLTLDGAPREARDKPELGSDRDRVVNIRLTQQEHVSEQIALSVMPLTRKDIATVTRFRQADAVLSDYCRHLDGCSGVPCSEPFDPPAQLPGPVVELLRVVSVYHGEVMATLKELVLECTEEEDTNPWTKDGTPSTVTQKLMREVGSLGTIMRLVELHFNKGIAVSWMRKKFGPNRDRYDPRLEKVAEIARMSYRCLQQAIKWNQRSALVLSKFVPTIYSHLGQSLNCTSTLRNIFNGQRGREGQVYTHLLGQITTDMVEKFAERLSESRDPRFADFLQSICTCDGVPVPPNQDCVIGLLGSRNLLPILEVTGSGNDVELTVRMDGRSEVVRMSQYRKTTQTARVVRELCDVVMVRQFEELSAEDKLVRYLAASLDLYADLSLGRNAHVLTFLLKRHASQLCFTYEDILKVMASDSMPSVIRSRYATLMLRFFVDRHPQSSQPSLLFTRVWTRVSERMSLEKNSVKPFGAADIDSPKSGNLQTLSADLTIPTCPTGFVDLRRLMLEQLQAASADQGVLAISPESSWGPIEYVKAAVSLCDVMADFRLWNIGTLAEGNSDVDRTEEIKELTEALLLILKRIHSTLQGVAGRNRQRLSAKLQDLGSQVTDLMMKLFDLRSNARLTLAVHQWENIYDRVQQQLVEAWGDENRGANHVEESFGKIMEGQSETLRNLQSAMFSPDIFLPAKSQFRDPVSLERVLFELGDVKSGELRERAFKLLFRHKMEKAFVVQELRQVQLLVYSEAVHVFGESESVMRRLIELKAKLAADHSGAVHEAQALVRALSGHIVVTDKVSRTLVKKHQTIMLNQGLERAIVSILQLPLARKPREEDGVKDADIAQNDSRRELFQVLYDFLKNLATGNRAVQERLFVHFDLFVSHCGILHLNVSDSLHAILQDNLGCLSLLRSDFMFKFVNLITRFGRKARWLAFLKVFLSIRGRPIQRNQDTLLALLLNDADEILDLTGSYVDGAGLAATDERYGKTRLELMLMREHERKFGSLLKYHVCSLDLLAACGKDKNPSAKAKLAELLPISKVLHNIMSLDRLPPEEGAGRHPQLDADTVHYVQKPWVQVLLNVYLSSLDQEAMRACMNYHDVIWPSEEHDTCLMQQMRDAIASLPPRLAKASALGAGSHASLKDGVPFWGVSDDMGSNLGHHIEYAQVCLGALLTYFSGNLFEAIPDNNKMDAMNLAKEIRTAVERLHNKGEELRLDWPIGGISRDLHGAIGAVVNLPGGTLVHAALLPVKDKSLQPEEVFKRGFVELHKMLGVDYHGKDTMKNQRMWLHSVRSLGMLFGTNEGLNVGSPPRMLAHLLTLLADTKTDVFIRTQGLRTVRSIIYLQPNNSSLSEAQREEQFQLFLNNEPPTYSDAVVGLQMEATMAGAINAILNSLDGTMRGQENEADEGNNVLGALRLGATLLEHGNRFVQDRFVEALRNPASQGFFLQLRNLLENSVEGIKEDKRRAKQAILVREEMQRGNISMSARGSFSSGPTNVLDDSKEDLASHVQTIQVVKLMRLLCAGQHRRLQDLLRVQAHNRESVDLYDEVVKYISALEPGLKSSIDRTDDTCSSAVEQCFNTLADAMRGPNVANQNAIASTGIFDLVDLIMMKLRLTGQDRSRGIASLLPPHSTPPGVLGSSEPLPLAKGGSLRSIKDPVSQDRHKPMSGIQKDPKKLLLGALELGTDLFGRGKTAAQMEKTRTVNNTRSKVKQAVLACLMAFLDGCEDDKLCVQMLTTLQWDNMMTRMVECYDAYQDNSLMDRSNAIKEGLGYYHLFRFINNFDSEKKTIEPIMFHTSARKTVAHFFEQRTGYIEISRSARLERIYFELPEECLSGTLDNDFEEMYQAERNDPDKKQQEYLSNMVRLIERERYHGAIRKTWLSFTIDHWQTCRSLTFNVALILQVVLVLGGYMLPTTIDEMRAHEADNSVAFTPTERYILDSVHPQIVFAAVVIGWVQLALCCLRAFCFFYSQFPIIASRIKEDYGIGEEDDGDLDERRTAFGPGTDDGVEGDDNDEEDETEESALMGPRYRLQDEGGQGEGLLDFLAKGPLADQVPDIRSKMEGMSSRARIHLYFKMAMHPWIIYEIFFLLFPVLAVGIPNPLLISFALFEICSWNGSRTVIDAVRFNFVKMTQTLLLGLLVMYIWMIVGFGSLREEHQDDSCRNLFSCFLAYVYSAIRGDGIMTLMDDIQVPNNVIDAFEGGRFVLLRIIFDITHFFIFILILIAIITGIVIDSFSSLREENDNMAEDLRTKCFVCNLDKFPLDQNGVGFDLHVKQEHNPRWYLFFLFGLLEKDNSSLTGQERYVKSLTWPKQDYSWLPREQTFTLKDSQLGDEMGQMREQVGALSSQMASMQRKIDQALERMNDAVQGAVTPPPQGGKN
uniref:Inositol 1,4,5-trisphosphate receptor n=1 Tax=Hemiselmis tepida TaxID=464990 RepID=A0A7S0Z297_9CRYP|mmetsp:Transcript_4253/g.10910  ORF Transcript_4253/g.10910 Transcript_4253/m.10910 type:complete len:2887 (+) Transcript_4253:179-8839(+)